MTAARVGGTAALLVFLCGVACNRAGTPVAQAASPAAAAAAKEPPPAEREIRLTGLVVAVHSSKIQVPQIYGDGSPLTLTHLIANGSKVNQGDLLATFDPTTQMDKARDAAAKADDLGHQADQKRAQNHADAEKRASDLKQAEADLSKAQIELRKGPLLSEIDRLKNEEKASIAAQHVESLKKSMALHDKADDAALRILELQRDRQKVMLERTQSNIDKLTIKAPLSGMVAIQNVFRANNFGRPQEGDQLYRGQALVNIFDPGEMAVNCAVGEPDGRALKTGARATVYLDAYPGLTFPAHLEFASPVAAAALGSPIRSFGARFRIEKTDPHMLPDMSAAVVLEAPPAEGAKK